MASRSYLSLTKDELAHAEALHRENIVIDASIVAFIEGVGEDLMLEDMAKGGLTASNATVCMQRNLSEAMREVTDVHEWAEKKKAKALIVRKVADIEKAKKAGKSALILGPQDSMFLEAKTAFLEIAWDVGIRIIQLSYLRSDAADGCWDRVDGGLTNFGVDLVEAMNNRGMLIDLSHVGDRSTMEAIELSKQPVSFTHVIPRATTPRDLSPYAKWAGGERFVKVALGRGRTDEALKACTEKGGMVGVTPFFAKTGKPTTLTDDLMDQVDYFVKLVSAPSTSASAATSTTGTPSPEAPTYGSTPRWLTSPITRRWTRAGATAGWSSCQTSQRG